MSSGTCNGLCARHPKRTKKRILLVNFDREKDAVCRQCECYFKNMPGVNWCPCCHRRLSRRLSSHKYGKKRIAAALKKIATVFRDFWKMVEKNHRRSNLTYKKKDLSWRRCLLCNSKDTYIQKNRSRTPVWIRYLHSYICLKCHLRNGKRIKYFERCPLGTLILR